MYLEYSVSTSMHLIGPLQVPKCDSDLIQASICRNLQVYTETCLTLHLYYSGLARPGAMAPDTLDKFIL